MKHGTRCAVLGLGRQGYCHAVNLAKHVPGASLSAVVDLMPGVAEKVATDLDVPVWSSSPDDIMARDDIDAIIVATPTDTHASLAEQVAKSGKALFLEKPLSLNLDEARRAMEVVQTSGIPCQLGFMRRFDPAYSHARERILAGDIGQPLYLKAVSRDPTAPPEHYLASSGGIFLDQNIHDYDIARFLMGQEVVEVTAMGSVLYTKAAEKYGDVDQALTYLRFQSGAAGDVEGYRNAFYGYDIRAEILGTEGSLVVSGLQQHNVTLLRGGTSSYEVMPGFLERFRDAYLIEMVSFIRCVQRGEAPQVGVVDGFKALEIATAARESYARKHPVSTGDTRA